MRKVGENITKKLSTQKLVAIIRAKTVVCSTLKPDKRAESSLVEQRCRCADAMRMTLKVPIRMVLGVVEHICAIKPARMCWCHAERDLKYDCRRTGF
tara:strand:+ start:2019 stop:2309 length:291 start_codon:yes stop_codon:yes gene_type:complete